LAGEPESWFIGQAETFAKSVGATASVRKIALFDTFIA
jgi:hypothetical protein